MTFADPNDLPSSHLTSPKQHWFIRLWNWFNGRIQPAMGWPVLICALLLALLPSQAANINEWIVLGEYGSTLTPVGLLGVLLTWWLMGWRHDRAAGDHAGLSSTPESPQLRFGPLYLALLFVILGFFVISQALVGWIPGPARLIQAAFTDNFAALFAESGAALATIGTRFVRWWVGVLAGGATQDDLVFATFAGIIVWLNGILTGYLVRRRYSGLLAGFPSLWLLLMTMLYGSVGRMIFITALLVALLLHVLLDQQRLRSQWDSSKISYGDGLMLDRLLAVFTASLLIFGLASVVPNLRLSGLADRYLQLYQPFNDQVEDFGQRLFPDMKVTSRFRGAALSDGLPNSFLLGSGPELSETEVMRVRTDDPLIFEPEILEEVPAVGHYIRGGSLSVYDGLGWANPIGVERIQLEADQYVPNLLLLEDLEIADGSPEVPRGRRLLTQDIFLRFNSRGLYGAAEPISFSVDYRLDRRTLGDQTSFTVQSPTGGSVGASSYTVVSAIPYVNESALAAENAFFPNDEDPLWNALAHHLSLPNTVTERTRELAAELTDDLDSPYAKAVAIETYLREFDYDLSVSGPPSDVQDVADYFLFDLQRGYCDYYATAFVVLARLAGLPARFSTGFAPGRWSGAEQLWIITEAEAHSWPEVYFASYGWIPFEPTAGRSLLLRSGIGVEREAAAPAPLVDVPTVAPEVETQSTWNWQMLFWLLPLAGLLWGLYWFAQWWQRNRQDPWVSVLRWGQRIGRPMQEGETVLEYGNGLGDFVLERYRHHNQDVGRRVAREISSLAEKLTVVQYGTAKERRSASDRIDEMWSSLRSYIANL